MSIVPASLRGPGLPTPVAGELGVSHRRTRRTRLALVGVAFALVSGCFFVARSLEALPTTYFAESTGGIVVLDLSTSVDAVKARRAERVLRTFARTEGRVGLVVFSDSAYEMFPPDTRSEELRPLLRFFERRGPQRPNFGRFSRGRNSSTPPPRELETPWSLSFRGGTRVSTGLAEARHMIEREGDRSLSVLLLSDLDNSGFDQSTLTEELVAYRREGIPLRVIPLFPAPEDRAFFEAVVGKAAMLKDIELVRNTQIHERRTLVGAFPWLLVLGVAGLLVLLALNERLLGRVAWRTGPVRGS